MNPGFVVALAVIAGSFVGALGSVLGTLITQRHQDRRDVLAKIASQPQAVCVLLASRVMDDYLWHQVIRHHGYDVVAKPFQPEELRRAVTFAWSWRGWAYRHHADALRKPTS